MPPEGYTGPADVPCPDVGDEARAWWATWATSKYAHFFQSVEWLDLADTTRIMDRFYQGDTRAMAEVRQHTASLFGLATKMRLHISEAGQDGDPDAAPGSSRPRNDPRLKAV